jgi:hypothetical protein
MTLETIDYLNGISSLLYAIIAIIIGITIAAKYLKMRDKNYLYIGLGFLGLAEPWLPSGISFLWNLIYNRGLNLEIYVIIGNIFIPVCIVLWVTGIANLMNAKNEKKIRNIYIILGVVFEIIFFILLSRYTSLIGVFSSESTANIDIQYRTFLLGYLSFCIFTVFISATLFARSSLKAILPSIKLRGKLILIAVSIWALGAFLDTGIPLNLITLPITRIMLVSAAILAYLGFIMPSMIKKLFIRE